MRKFAFKRKATQAADIGTLAHDIQYDLFAVDPDNCSLWLETITGLDNAEQRMKERAAEKPGDYFIYDTHKGVLVSVLHTLPKAG
jgi:hypothetical protein